jgi:predicted aspartyl protease
MASGLGKLNARGCPSIEIEVSGALPTIKRKITALIDTGFSGFLLIPMMEAFPIGLVLHGTTNVTLADGSSHSKLTCLGFVEMDNTQEMGVIIIEERTTEALLGMEFLRKFRVSLLADPDTGTVSLFPSDILKKALANTSGSGSGTP